MAFNWNFKPKTLAGFNSQPVETLNPQTPQPLNLQMKGMMNVPGNNLIGNQDYSRAVYMDEYEADEARKAQALQAQAEGRQNRISQLQSQIAELEKRIADNKVKLNSWNGNAEEIAAIEARKIYSQDPTSIWRWKVDRDETRKLARDKSADNVTRANALFEIKNDLDSIVVKDDMDSQTQSAFLSKLANLRTLAQKNNLPTDDIDKKIAEVKGETNAAAAEPETQIGEDFEYTGTPAEQGSARVAALLQKNFDDLTQKELDTFFKDVKSGKIIASNEEKNKLSGLRDKVVARDKKRAEDQAREDRIIKKGKNITQSDIDFMKGRKGVIYKTDDNGNEWFEKV